MLQAKRLEPGTRQVSGRDNLTWHPASRSASAIVDASTQSPEEIMAAQLRIVARLEEETHTLTSQLGYIQTLLQQTRETLTLLHKAVQWNALQGTRKDVHALAGRLAKARTEDYPLPAGRRP